MTLVREEKVYRKITEDGCEYFLHEVMSGGQMNRFLTFRAATGPAWMPGEEWREERVTYRITKDFELEVIDRLPPINEMSNRIRKLAEKLVEKKARIAVTEMSCPNCDEDSFGVSFLFKPGSYPIHIGCSDAIDYLRFFVDIDDSGEIFGVKQSFEDLRVEMIERSYLRELLDIERWIDS